MTSLYYKFEKGTPHKTVIFMKERPKFFESIKSLDIWTFKIEVASFIGRFEFTAFEVQSKVP